MTLIRHIPLRGKCPCAPHHIAIIAVKAISTFLQPPSVFYGFLSTALTADEIHLTHYSDHLKANDAAESFNSAASCHSGCQVFCLSSTISGDNVPKHPIMQPGDFSGHGNLAAWKYLYNPVTIFNFFTW